MKELEFLSDDYDHELIIKIESHNHPLDNSERIRWQANKEIDDLTNEIGLNDIVVALFQNGYDKNSEMFRYLYRSMGVSLYLYWEVFYWEANNENCLEYKYSEKDYQKAKEQLVDFLNYVKKNK